MRDLIVLALRLVLGAVLAGCVLVQAVIVPLLYLDLDDLDPEYAHVRIPLVVIAFLGVATVEVTVVCVWRLLTRVRRDTVFSDASFRDVDVIMGAVATAAVLTFGLAVVMAPGEAVAPGVVGLVCGLALLIGGGALIVLVLRMLLAQAVARDTEARDLRAELSGVI
jgi:hypothetical protein